MASPPSSVIAEELSRVVRTSSSAVRTRPAGADDDDTETTGIGPTTLKSALSGMVDSALDCELTELTESIVSAAAGGSDDEGTDSCDQERLGEMATEAADRIIENSSAYRVLREAVIKCARQVRSGGGGSSSDDDINGSAADGTIDGDDDEASNKKMKRDNTDEDATSEVWPSGLADDSEHPPTSNVTHDPFDSFANDAAPTAAVAAKSFSLFDMLDSQQVAAPTHLDRVSAEQILDVFATSPPGDGGEEQESPSASATCRHEQYNSAASLLERVDDMEDLLFDPFGSGDVWPDINRVLRSGLGISCCDNDVGTPYRPSSDILIRYARIHSHLDGLCGQSSSYGIDFGIQRVDLATNVADAVNGREDGWYQVDSTQQIRFDRDMAILVRTLIDLLTSAAPTLESIPEEDCKRFVSSAVRIFAKKEADISPAHAIASRDPYADCFSLVGRFAQPAILVQLSVETGMLSDVIERCNGEQGISIAATDASMDNLDMVTVGTTSDLEHCFFLQSLSILRTFLVATAGSEALFPYQLNRSTGPITEGDTLRVLNPFVNVLAAGVSEGGDIVDEALASICEEASSAMLRGIMRNKRVFEAVFDASIAPIARDLLARGTSDRSNAASAAIMRLHQLHTAS